MLSAPPAEHREEDAMSKILVINGHCLGEYCDVAVLPKAGATVSAHKRRQVEDGGKGTNVAVAIGRLGGSVAFINKCGDDEGGRLGRKWMREAGVDLRHYVLDPNIDTNTGLCVIAEDGSNVIINFFDEKNAITPEELDACLPRCIDAEYLITGFELPWRTALYAARLGKKLGLYTVLNPSPLEPDADLGTLDFVDTLVVNETEAGTLLNRSVGRADGAEAAAALQARYGVTNVVITLGAEGSLANTPENIFRAEPFPVRAVDTVGAGDGYLAALVWRLSEGDAFDAAMNWASRYAAYVCTHIGTIAAYPTLEQLEAFWQKYPAL